MANKRLLDKDEIRRQTDLAEVISAHVALKGVGKRLRGLCPFHTEKTPSFYVDPESGLWHCFGCKAGGDVFAFVGQINGLSFAESAQWLARRLGGEFRQNAVRQTSETQRQAALNQEAAGFFRRTLSGAEGKIAWNYLEKRQISSEAAIRFGLGYAPAEWDRLFLFLRDRGFKQEEIFHSGLCLPRPNSGGGYDRFRNRLIFPIADVQERVVGFGGRALSAEDEPKYLNSPETLLFQKGRMFYGLPWAARALAKSHRAIVVEGYFDLIRCHLAGIEEAVATLGTALTSAHLELLRRRQTEQVYLAFDADSAGLSAALRSREIAAASGLRVLAVPIPQGHDPDTLVQAEGTEALENALAQAKPLLELALEQVLAKYDGLPESERLGLLKEGAALLSDITEQAERHFYITWLAERFCGQNRGHLEKAQQILLGELAALQSQSTHRRSTRPRPDRTALQMMESQLSGLSPLAKQERMTLAFLLAHSSLLLEKSGLICVEDFSEPLHCKLVETMLLLADAGQEPSGDRVSLHFEDDQLRALVAELALGAEPWMAKSDAEKLIDRLRMAREEQRRRELTALVANEKDRAKSLRLQAELQALSSRKSRQVGRWVVGE